MLKYFFTALLFVAIVSLTAMLMYLPGYVLFVAEKEEKLIGWGVILAGVFLLCFLIAWAFKIINKSI
jgi:hypothetical protein